MGALTHKAPHKGVRTLQSANLIITVFQQTFIKCLLGGCYMCNDGLTSSAPMYIQTPTCLEAELDHQ